MVSEEKLAEDRNDVGRVESDGAEGEHGIHGDDRGEVEQSKDRCRGQQSVRKARRRTGQEAHEPDRVHGDLVARETREEPSVGQAAVTGEGVEGPGVGLERSGDDGERGETDERPEDEEQGETDVVHEDRGDRVSARSG